METVSLSRIVMKLAPEMFAMLTDNELGFQIVLRDGLEAVDREDAWEIIQYSIYRHQKDAPLH
jgi:hypothetical protein